MASVPSGVLGGFRMSISGSWHVVHRPARAPVYSHIVYDVIPNHWIEVSSPDILIVEGVNVLQAARPPKDGNAIPFVSDFFDFSIYVDARIEDIEKWYVRRFLALRATAFADPQAHFHHYAGLTDAQATMAAEELWHNINRPNLVENILPTRPRATLVLRKDADHSINRLRLRKL